MKDRKHLKFIASLSCVICGRQDTQAAHIRSGNGAGMGLKSPDSCTVPLCVKHHEAQHKTSERLFWGNYGGIEKATKLANDLYEHTGDEQKARELKARWKLIY